MTQTLTYPLRLPRSLKRAVERQSKEDRTSINQIVATAVAEKISALQTAEFFADRESRADFKAFDKLMRRRGGKLHGETMKWVANWGLPEAVVKDTGAAICSLTSRVSWNQTRRSGWVVETGGLEIG
jgi:hypothetical protein